MAMIGKHENAYLLDVEKYFHECHKKLGLFYSEELFNIYCQFSAASKNPNTNERYTQSTRKKKCKRKFMDEDIELHNDFKEVLRNCYISGLASGYFHSAAPDIAKYENNESAKAVAADHKVSPLADLSYKIAVQNLAPVPEYFHTLVQNEEQWLTIKCCEEEYLIPPLAAFIMSDIRFAPRLLTQYLSPFDLIVIDPPWENKSVKRRKNYYMLDEGNLLSLPVRKLLKPGGLVAVWCTCSPKQQGSLTDTLFPAWNLTHVVTWYWVKVTKLGQPILDFDNAFRRPYELLYLATHQSVNSEGPPRPRPPRDRVLISVPMSIHSSKPPLSEVLEPYLPEDAKCLELFARNLLPGWTSWGNEPLKLQKKTMFTTKECQESGSTLHE